MHQDDFIIYQRRLPHWRIAGSIYFVTWRLAKDQADLKPTERDQVVSTLLHFQGERYHLLAHVVMNDHVHVLVKPIQDHSLQEIIRSWKSYSAHQLVFSHGRTSPVWQDEYFDRIMRDEAELREKANYILGNPWKRWPGLDEYAWVGCDWEAGRE